VSPHDIETVGRCHTTLPNGRRRLLLKAESKLRRGPELTCALISKVCLVCAVPADVTAHVTTCAPLRATQCCNCLSDLLHNMLSSQGYSVATASPTSFTTCSPLRATQCCNCLSNLLHNMLSSQGYSVATASPTSFTTCSPLRDTVLQLPVRPPSQHALLSGLHSVATASPTSFTTCAPLRATQCCNCLSDLLEALLSFPFSLSRSHMAIRVVNKGLLSVSFLDSIWRCIPVYA
jgi:uncharacterized protein YjaG (DUF416 family)